MKSALILVDLQNDFMPGGKLAVREGLEVLPAINQLVSMPFDVIVATKDWHPKGHGSFASAHAKNVGDVVELMGIPQILWPDHCVQDTPGAAFHPGWDHDKAQKVFLKGTDHRIDSYSTFYDNSHLKSTGLAEYLKARGIRRVFLAGLATDYCVKYSALDALTLGFETHVVPEGCRGVNLKATDEQTAYDEMKSKGAVITPLSQVAEMLRGGGI